MTDVLTPYTAQQEAQESIRLDAWRAVLQKSNRILSGQRVTVSIVDQPDQIGMAEVPAWSDGLDIFLSRPKLVEMLKGKDKLSAVLRLKGLNYHELCHVLYTPRMTDEICRRVVQRARDSNDSKWWYAFNALEDQRIETWFTATYSASRRYFEAIVLEWIISNGSPEAAVLIYGRKYLTPRIRVKAGEVFVKRYGKDLYQEFQTVIDEYLTLTLPPDSIRAMQLLIRYHELLVKMQSMSGAPMPTLIMQDNGGDDVPADNKPGVARQGRVFVKPARSAAKRAQEQIDDAIDADADLESEKAGGDGDQSQGGGQGKAQDSGDQSGNGGDPGGPGGDDQSDPSAQKGAGADEVEGGGGAGTSGVADHGVKRADKSADPQPEKTLKEEMEELADQAYQDVDDVRDDDSVQADLDAMLDAVNAAVENGKMNAQGIAVGGATASPSSSANMAVRRVHDILARIRQEAEPETLWRQQHGRVDARRVVQRKPHEIDIFKTWDSGSEEETGVEAVMLCDMSGSMSSRLADAALAMWALKRAFDKLDIRTTVLLFDTDHKVVYQPSEKAQGGGVPVLRAGGGTNPLSAMRQAELILTKSSQPNKVLITITDGQWGADDNQVKAIMRRLHRQGVVSLMLGLTGAVQRYGAHHHLESHDLSSISDLPKAALKVVARIMRNAVYV